MWSQLRHVFEHTEKRRGRTGVIDRSADKDAMRQVMIKRLREERELLQSYIKGGRLDFFRTPRNQSTCQRRIPSVAFKGFRKQKLKRKDGRWTDLLYRKCRHERVLQDRFR